MKPYPLFRRENVPSYLKVIATWVIVSIVWAAVLVAATDSLRFGMALVFAAVATMSGMMIMFGASLLNLRTLSPGFQRLAQGADDPRIPSVWCPVLTAATNAAVELASSVHEREDRRGSDEV